MKSSAKIIGTLVPMSALRSNKFPTHTDGTFDEGVVFVEWLHKTKQNAWQLLPIHETYKVASPYKSYGIGIDPKYAAGESNASEDKMEFVEKNKNWLYDYATFCAIRDEYKTDDWTKWDSGLRNRHPDAMAQWSKKLKIKIDAYIIKQWTLYQSYSDLKHKAHAYNIHLIGDMPFYLPLHSPLVWTHQELFDFNRGEMKKVSGVPDMYYSHFGRQVWGHPLYRFDGARLTEHIVELFKMRLTFMASLFDIVRFDYATGFYQYGALDKKNKKRDSFKKGPGTHVLAALIKHMWGLGVEVIVDDSANRKYQHMNTLLKKLKVPTSKILRFAYNEKLDKLIEKNANIAEYEENILAYTTTHDSETLVGYLKLLKEDQKKQLATFAKVAFSKNDKTLAVHLREALIRSKARIVIIPIQDWLLTTDRINTPGTEKKHNDLNWRYRLTIPIENLPTNLP